MDHFFPGAQGAASRVQVTMKCDWGRFTLINISFFDVMLVSRCCVCLRPHGLQPTRPIVHGIFTRISSGRYFPFSMMLVIQYKFLFFKPKFLLKICIIPEVFSDVSFLWVLAYLSIFHKTGFKIITFGLLVRMSAV